MACPWSVALRAESSLGLLLFRQDGFPPVQGGLRGLLPFAVHMKRSDDFHYWRAPCKGGAFQWV